MHPQGPQTEQRLTRLEESVGFIDHASAQVSTEVAELGRELAALARRLTALERRLSDMTDSLGEAANRQVPPPHSAGPDISRDPL